MAKRNNDLSASAEAILGLLIETVYAEPERAAWGLNELGKALRRPLSLRDFTVWGFPDLKLQPDGQPNWDLPVQEIRTILRKVFEHLAQWKEANSIFGGAGVQQTGVPVPVTLRISLGNDGAEPHRHFFALQGSPRDVFLATTLLLLAHGTSAKVLKCPECHRVFYRTRNSQSHCGKKCYDRQYWREKYPPDKKARARRIQYDKRGWSLGAKGSVLGQQAPSPSLKSKRRPTSKRKGE
ncbi:MAG: hypothetical protein HOP16_08340 [Acidobacteria bacterium]|nr:hypothetical protein [Acidobacteriota bacterium]